MLLVSRGALERAALSRHGAALGRLPEPFLQALAALKARAAVGLPCSFAASFLSSSSSRGLVGGAAANQTFRFKGSLASKVGRRQSHYLPKTTLKS